MSKMDSSCLKTSSKNREIHSLDSDDSILELEKPPPLPPPIIDIEEEYNDVVINVLENPNSLNLTNSTHIGVSSELRITDTSCPYGNNDDLSKDVPDYSSPYHWTADMKNFYNNDTKKSFVISKVLRKMAKWPKLWEVSRLDVDMAVKCHRKRIKCHNCQQEGHKAWQCDQRPKQSICHMCSIAGHSKNNCPLSMCLTCGIKTKYYKAECSSCKKQRSNFCDRCQVKGHYSINCTDHWRRFHDSTTLENVNPPSRPVNKPWDNIWCCNCAERGHESFTCLQPNSNEFRPSFPFVFSYEGVRRSNPQQLLKRWRYFEQPQSKKKKSKEVRRRNNKQGRKRRNKSNENINKESEKNNRWPRKRSKLLNH